MSEYSLLRGSICFLYLVGTANTGINTDRSEREPMPGLVRLSLKALCAYLDKIHYRLMQQRFNRVNFLEARCVRYIFPKIKINASF